MSLHDLHHSYVLGYTGWCLACDEQKPVTRLELKIIMESLSTPVARETIENRFRNAVKNGDLNEDILEYYFWDKEV